MNRRGVLTTVLAVTGTILVWLPLLAPVFFSTVVFFQSGIFHTIDYLMPAELFLLVLVGGLLLLWAALQVRQRRWLIGGSLLAAVVLLFAMQGLAVVTGLASGETEAAGWQFALVLGMVFGYILAVLVLGVGGILLLVGQGRAPKLSAEV